jgi:hypothetical protein
MVDEVVGRLMQSIITKLALLLVLISPLTLFARTSHKIFPATAGSVLAENQRADALGIKRYETLPSDPED